MLNTLLKDWLMAGNRRVNIRYDVGLFAYRVLISDFGVIGVDKVLNVEEVFTPEEFDDPEVLNRRLTVAMDLIADRRKDGS